MNKQTWNGISIESVGNVCYVNWNNLSLNMGQFIAHDDLFLVIPYPYVIGDGYGLGQWNTDPLDEMVNHLVWFGYSQDKAILQVEEYFYDLCNKHRQAK